MHCSALRASSVSAITACSVRPARRRNWRRRARRSRCHHPIRSSWSLSRLSCIASSAMSTCVASIVQRPVRAHRAHRAGAAALAASAQTTVTDETHFRFVCRALGAGPRQGSAQPFGPVRAIQPFARACLRTSLPVISLANARVHFLWRPHRHDQRLTAATAALQSP